MLPAVQSSHWCAVMMGRRSVIQLAVLFVAVLAVVCAVRAAFHDPYGLNGKSLYVCVESGRLFSLSTDEAGMVPARNPQTGDYTLLPCARTRDGRLRVGERYRPVLVEQLADTNRRVDPATLTVR